MPARPQGPAIVALVLAALAQLLVSWGRAHGSDQETPRIVESI